MIRLTRLNHIPVLVNADLIEQVEITPDTVVSLTNGHKLMVLESAEEVRDRVLEFRRAINQVSTCSNCHLLMEKAPNDGDGQ